MLAQRAEDRPRRRSSTAGTSLRYLAGKPPPRLTMDRLMPRSAQSRKIAAADFERLVPGLRVALLRADVERHAIGVEPEPLGVLEHVDRHLAARSRTCATAATRRRRSRTGMRQNTLAPGAARAIFSTSALASTANSRTPSA